MLLYITLSVCANWCCCCCCCHWCWLQLRTFHYAFSCIFSSECTVGAAAVIIVAVFIIIIIDFNVEGILCPRKCNQNIYTWWWCALTCTLPKINLHSLSTSQSICIRFRLMTTLDASVAFHVNRLISIKLTAINCNKVYRRNYSLMVMSRLGNILYAYFICFQFSLLLLFFRLSHHQSNVKWKWCTHCESESLKLRFLFLFQKFSFALSFGRISFYFHFFSHVQRTCFCISFYFSSHKKHTLSHAKFQVYFSYFALFSLHFFASIPFFFAIACKRSLLQPGCVQCVQKRRQIALT